MATTDPNLLLQKSAELLAQQQAARAARAAAAAGTTMIVSATASDVKAETGEVPADATITTFEGVPDDVSPEGAPTALMAELRDASDRILAGFGQVGSISYGVTLPPAGPTSSPTVAPTFAPAAEAAPAPSQGQPCAPCIVLAQAGVALIGFRPEEVRALANLGQPRLSGAS